ncbi:spermidine/putrescine ABC transporter substrate-binding protein [Cryobacterium sp. SO2]|uniref:spermidine/putrescine ABC transporter substrate-binding protein n=1 Tax=Cryobacterium sp. SO2 TaxID=1897060 RepID=UPI00223D5224|nr:spermidine/putrescine ABC transporter substrate-binding protein [Cryobacterium sp. SO2]WEO76788.1 spermidine/putrescine ABC transporter substrate-binding protein [Cryobacterium sp. SO2]
MDASIESRVDREVEAWLRWVPRWRPGTHRARSRLCQQCLGSPVLKAAGLVTDVPHAVQHPLSMRIKTIVEDEVENYTAQNLPMLDRELGLIEERRAAQAYRPLEGLGPEFDGIDLDAPPPEPDSPYLFTFEELAQPLSADDPELVPPPLTIEEKAALRVEMRLADDFATLVGKRVCAALAGHRAELRRAVDTFVEPQVQALLADLGSTLDPHGT